MPQHKILHGGTDALVRPPAQPGVTVCAISAPNAPPRKSFVRKSQRASAAITAAALLLILLSACQHKSTTPAAKRFAFTGLIISIDAQGQSAVINGNDVPGFMDAMAMSYKIKPPSTLAQLAPGDSISADVVVVDPTTKTDDSVPDYWLENVKVTAHGKLPASAPTSSLHVPAPGEQVPDFAFTNQSGRRISLQQYRGKVLFVTFVYTRCPFPDFCPRVSNNFAEIYKQLDANPALAAAHLLTISFDPAHDTPKVLRDYAFSVAHTHEPALFTRWEFAAPRTSDLSEIADFFALTIQTEAVQTEAGIITHNLSTTVIGPDGKVVAWYHGGDWQVSDLIKEATSTVAHKA
jgi:protein SCO1/2